MTAIAALAWACLAVGLEPAECWAVASVESGMGADLEHDVPTVRGLMGVDLRWSTVPGWALDTTVGGAVGGARAIRYWREAKGARWARHYGCGWKAAAPACLRYERRINDTLRRLRAPRET